MIFRRKSDKRVTEPDAEGESPGPDPAQLQCDAFEKSLLRHEDLLYGIGLFFESLYVLYAGQDDVIETYRKQFRNIIQHGKEVAQTAMALLEEARGDPAKLPQLKQFRFSLGQTHPEPDELMKRAGVLVDTYERLFPGRSRSQTLTREETMRLIDEAAGEF